MKRIAAWIFAMVLPMQISAQINPVELSTYCDSIMEYGVNYPLIPGGIISVVSLDSIYLLKGYGYGKLESNDPVNPETTLFQLGSVGKVFTAIAALQQVESGDLNLNADVNNYLPKWKIENPYSKPVTLQRLLTHSAGFDDRVIGYMTKSQIDLQSLGQHLENNMPELFQEPGLNINYSNYSYALAGHLVELTSGMNFEDYIEANILRKLGMNHSTYFLPNDYDSITHPEYANGYQLRDDFKGVKVYPRHAKPAGSLLSSGKDMAIFMQALIKNDTNLLRKETYPFLLTQQFTNHPLLTGYTLGMEVQNFNGYPAVGKGGNITGFLSIFILFPKDSLGLFVSVNTQTDNFLELFFEGLINKFFPLQETNKKEIENINIEEYAGVYINERANHHTIEEMFELFEGQFSIWKSSSGNLACFHNGKTREYVPYEKDIFRNKENPYQYIVFARSNGDIKNMYRNFVLGGIQVPSTYKKAKWFERPRFINDEYPYVLLIIFSYLLLPLFWFVTFVIRKKKNKNFLISASIPAYYHAIALLFLGLFIWQIAGFWLPLLKDRQQLFFEFNQSLYSMRYFNYAMVAVAGILVLLAGIQWIKKHGNIWVRIYFSLYSLTSLSLILLLYRWHFISLTYK